MDLISLISNLSRRYILSTIIHTKNETFMWKLEMWIWLDPLHEFLENLVLNHLPSYMRLLQSSNRNLSYMWMLESLKLNPMPCMNIRILNLNHILCGGIGILKLNLSYAWILEALNWIPSLSNHVWTQTREAVFSKTVNTDMVGCGNKNKYKYIFFNYWHNNFHDKVSRTSLNIQNNGKP